MGLSVERVRELMQSDAVKNAPPISTATAIKVAALTRPGLERIDEARRQAEREQKALNHEVREPVDADGQPS